MAIVKWLAGIALLLVLVVVVGGLLLPGTYTVTRSVLVNAPPEKVYPLVADPRRWKEWSVWTQRDPAMAITYFGPASGNGAGWEWKSASQGDGRMTFTAATPPQRIDYALYFPDFGTTSTGDFRFVPEAGATRVRWAMDGNMGRNPLYHWFSVFADKMIGKDFDAGLAGLKALAEKP